MLSSFSSVSLSTHLVSALTERGASLAVAFAAARIGYAGAFAVLAGAWLIALALVPTTLRAIDSPWAEGATPTLR